MKFFYDDIVGKITRFGKKVDDKIEVVGLHASYECELELIPRITMEFENYVTGYGYDLQHRKDMERFHYAKLRNSLFHSLAENFFYTKADLKYTRKSIALSTDCISCIQMKVVDDTLHCCVFMRSSHAINLLPVDLLFLLGLGTEYLGAAKHISDTFQCGWDNDIDKINKYKMSILFGSAHMDADMEP
jgi:hypothetical protein